jgi:hypothetical protein
VSAPAKQSRGRRSITQRQAGQKEVEASPPPVFISGERGEYFVHRGWKPPEDDINDLMDVLESFLRCAFVLKHNLRRVKKNIAARVGGH